MKYIIHLKLAEYNPVKKEKKADKEAFLKKSIEDAKNIFIKSIESLSKKKEIVILKEEFKGQTFSTAVVVNLDDKKRHDLVDFLRKLEIVELIEMGY